MIGAGNLVGTDSDSISVDLPGCVGASIIGPGEGEEDSDKEIDCENERGGTRMVNVEERRKLGLGYSDEEEVCFSICFSHLIILVENHARIRPNVRKQPTLPASNIIIMAPSALDNNFIQIAVPLKHPEDTYFVTFTPEYPGPLVS